MAASNVNPKPPQQSPAQEDRSERYRPLPTGTHGLDPELVKRDQRERLQNALLELIAQRGYQGVRIVDLARLAHVSQPTFYRLYEDKEDLFLSAYEDIARRTAETAMEAYDIEAPPRERLLAAMRAFTQLAMTEPDAISLLLLGAFGAGAKALERRRSSLEALEAGIRASRDGATGTVASDLTVKAVLGGVREVIAARLRKGRESELPELADELTAWASVYPRKLPDGLAAPGLTREGSAPPAALASERARRAEGRLPSGRSALPRQFIVKSQRERIVDATAAIVAEKGLAGLTVPEIARRANVSLQTFYDIYPSKCDAYLGAQKIGMHQALQISIKAYEENRHDWPRAVSAGLRALIDYLASEPAHAHLSLVDTFGASPEAMDIRDATLHAFAAYLSPGYELRHENLHVPAIAAEAVAGGIWQVLHNYIENDRIAELPGAATQLTYLALTPFLGPEQAALAATAPPVASAASAS